MFGGGAGSLGRRLLLSLTREKPGTHDGLRHFGGAKVVDIHYRTLVSNLIYILYQDRH